ncbi:hypothetical protein HPHPA4_0434 [Helicobacter pylori Hp A-4]|nr:hypothetical protein HPHPA4_0434 [Helicobacter pylori Hp A-4]
MDNSNFLETLSSSFSIMGFWLNRIIFILGTPYLQETLFKPVNFHRFF